ncbi:MAG: efflux RND transporter permease subunit [Ignavibacteriaceae bacterium]|nr:efflux RND transporter permease subunit [Ignavibacteriaceae bacterium]
MSLSSLSIRRPVLAIVMSIAVVLFGIIGYTYLGIREYPAVDPPRITVSTTYTGANADVIESQITEPLEEEINGIAGIRSLTSVSRDGRSTITVEFDIDVNLEDAANDVRDRVSRATRRLPPDVENPIVSKADADARPIVFLNVQSDTRNLLELTEIANNVFKERLQTIPGVSGVQIWGEKKYAMRLWMDPAKLAAYQLTPIDVRNAITRENVELPSGLIEGDNTELSIRTIGRLLDVDEFNNLIVKETSGSIVRFKDIGRAELGAENERTVLKRNGVPMVGVVLIAQAGANNIAITDEFYKRLDQLKQNLPPDIKTGIGFDVTKYIKDSITEVQQTIFIAFGLVVLIIFLFLRDWRTTIIPVIAIPISLIGAFFIMYIANFSINVLTLLGIVLAIGLVVDDAIVVLENIYTKIENKMEPNEAARRGSSEIFFAVVSTTVALASVFLPVIFLSGLTGRLFREFGIVISGAVIISSFVALTLTPMLSAKILKRRETHNWFYKKTEPFFENINSTYKNSLITFMKHRWLAFAALAVSFLFIYVFFKIIPSELAPLEDRSQLQLIVSAPEGATFEYMDNYMDELVQQTEADVPETEAIISVTSPGWGASGSVNSGFGNIILVQPDKRERTQQQIADDLTANFSKLTRARTFVVQQQTIGQGRGGLPVQYVIQAPNFEKLRETLPKFFEEVRQSNVFTVVDVNLKFNKPEIKITINRQRARDLGVSTIDIAQVIQSAFSGQRFGYYILNGKQYQVIGQLSRENRDEPIDLRSLYVKNNRGELIQLDNVINTSEESAPPQLYRFNRYVSATISAGLAPNKKIGDGITEMDKIAEKILDPSFSTALDGASKDFKESSSSLLFAFILALVLIYLVLAAQFESFRDPFIILFTVPLAILGALASLWYFNQTSNIFSQIGIIMLIGLVTKNGILLVEFANQRKAAGLERTNAIIDAAVARLRPILMTSFSTILGTLPIALALGAGSESRVSMGIAVIGGLIFSTFLTLMIVPVIYSFFSRKTAAVSNVTD